MWDSAVTPRRLDPRLTLKGIPRTSRKARAAMAKRIAEQKKRDFASEWRAFRDWIDH